MSNKFLLFTLMIVLCFVQFGMAQPRNNQNRPMRQFENTELSKNNEQEVLEYVKEAYPHKYQNLIKLRDNRPQLYRQTLIRAYREMEFSQRMKNENPEQFENLKLERELEGQSHELAEQYKNAETDEERKAIEAKLESVLVQAFEVRQGNREYEIKKLKERLMDLIEKNDTREKNKDIIIQKRMDELMGVDELNW